MFELKALHITVPGSKRWRALLELQLQCHVAETRSICRHDADKVMYDWLLSGRRLDMQSGPA